MSREENHPEIQKSRRFVNVWTVTAVLLILVIISCGAVIAAKMNHGNALEISLGTGDILVGRIYVSGEVNNPGFYPLGEGDNIRDILKAAGGLTGSDNSTWLELNVPAEKKSDTTQKVDINRAEAWLLAALPGIGETRAQSIIAYRRENGFFRDINELLNVPGIGNTTLEGIKNLVTVNE
jgi:competence protein ComEA